MAIKNATAQPKKSRVMVGLPPELKTAIADKAKAGKLSTANFIRQELARAVGYTGPLTIGTGRVRKYANDEERKKARKERNELMKRLLKEHEAAQAAATS